jgi:hypothetical protein
LDSAEERLVGDVPFAKLLEFPSNTGALYSRMQLCIEDSVNRFTAYATLSTTLARRPMLGIVS